MTFSFPKLVPEAATSAQRACQHEMRFVNLQTANGVNQIRRGCALCGYREKHSFPKRDHPDRGRYPIIVPRPSTLDRVDYETHLRSEDWLERREAAKARCGWRCQLCGVTGDEMTLHVHHNTYRRFGRELETDLCVLCEECHGTFHDRAELAEQRYRNAA